MVLGTKLALKAVKVTYRKWGLKGVAGLAALGGFAYVMRRRLSGGGTADSSSARQEETSASR